MDNYKIFSPFWEHTWTAFTQNIEKRLRKEQISGKHHTSKTIQPIKIQAEREYFISSRSRKMSALSQGYIDQVGYFSLFRCEIPCFCSVSSKIDPNRYLNLHCKYFGGTHYCGCLCYVSSSSLRVLRAANDSALPMAVPHPKYRHKK